MMKSVGIDTDFLICLSVEEHSRHKDAKHALEQLEASGTRFILCPQVISEFLHVITDSRRFSSPPSMETALEIIETWKSVSLLVSPSEETMKLFNDMMLRHRLGRKRILDTLLAATLVSHSIPSIMTGNGRDYRIFSELEIMEF